MEYFFWRIFKAKAFIVQHMAYEMLAYECKYFFIVRLFLMSAESALFHFHHFSSFNREGKQLRTTGKEMKQLVFH